MDRSSELEEQVRRLTQTIEEMRRRMARLEGREPSAEASNASDRRGFLRLGAGALLGALGWAAAKAVPASAATGGTMMLGQTNVAENATTLAGDSGNPVPVFSAAAQNTTYPLTTGNFTAPLQGRGTSNAGADGVDGWAGGPAGAGVYGLSDSGYGVIGESSTGIGLYSRTQGRIRQDGPFAGTPTHQPNLFEQVRDSAGVLWINNARQLAPSADQRPVWRRVNTLRVDAADGLGGVFKPFRRIDTRSGARRAAGSFTIVSIAGQGTGASAIPADAIAAVGNLTATAYTGPGFLTISPAGITVGTSTVNFQTGQSAIANSFICGLRSGALQVYVGGHPSHFLVDITGYIQ